MKNTFVGLALLGFLVVTPVSAQVGMMGSYQNGVPVSNITSPAISTALQDIYKTQNVSDLSQIFCTKVTDDQFEKLGDAYMGYGITEQQHTAMEVMMGGEGSATLTQAHINMGRAYLGCWSSSKPVSMPMAGMGYYGVSGSGGMMSQNGINYFGVSNGFNEILFMAIGAILALAVVALLNRFKKSNS